MRRVTSRATFRFNRRMFVSKWSLFVSVTLNAAGIRAGCESGLLQFKTAVRIMAIAATYRSFQHLVMERHIELRLHFIVATHTELRIARLQHVERCKARLLLVRRVYKYVRAGQILRDRVG